MLSLVQKTIRFSFYLLFSLVPLIFYAHTSELFEYNKIMLAYALTVVIGSAWLIKIVLTRQNPIGIIRQNFWNVPLLLYLASHILSTAFSIDPHVSFWGYYSRFHEGLLASICYIFLYFAAVSNLNKEDVKNIFLSSFLSTGVVSVWGILESFGHSPSCWLVTGNFDVSCWVQDVKNRVFATLGQPNWMAAYLCVQILILVGTFRSTPFFSRLFLIKTGLLLLSLWALYATRSRSGFLGLAGGLAVFLLLTINIPKRVKILIAVLVLVGSSIAGWIWWQTPLNLSPRRAESELLISKSDDIRRVVWEGAVKVWQRYPLFGSGVETFGYAYYQDRPVAHNLLSEWDFLYNKAHNEYLNLLATTGSVGFLAYLILIGSFIFFTTNLSRQPTSSFLLPPQGDILRGCIAAWTTILVTNFFGFSVVIIGLYFFLIPAFCFLLNRKEESSVSLSPSPLNFTTTTIILLIIFVSSGLLLKLFSLWQADKAYALGKSYQSFRQYLAANIFLSDAIQINPHEPVYRSKLAYNQAILASNLFEQLKTSTIAAVAALPPEQRLELEISQIGESVNSLIVKAAQNSDFAVAKSPYSVPFWKDRTKTFYQLANIDPKYHAKALEAISTAATLAPTDAETWYNLALVQIKTGNLSDARQTLEKVIQMKPDYTDALKTREELEL